MFLLIKLEHCDKRFDGTELGKIKLTYAVDVATYQNIVSRNGLDIKLAIGKKR